MPRSRCGRAEVRGRRSEVGDPVFAKAAYAEATARQGGRGSESRSQKRTTLIHFRIEEGKSFRRENISCHSNAQ